MKVSLSDLEDAMLFASGDLLFDHEAYLDRETGEFYYSSDGGDFDELPDDLEMSDKYLRVPNQHDLDLGKPLVFDFVFEYVPAEYDRIEGMFRRAGAYRRFKDFLETKDLIDTWYEYENTRTREALRTWCDREGIELEE
jgi:hypothetical protein